MHKAEHTHKNNVNRGSDIKIACHSDVEIRGLSVASDFLVQSRNRPIYDQAALFQKMMADRGTVVLALLDNMIIVGYAILDFPHKGELWAKLGRNVLAELKALEVSREYRGRCIAQRLLSHLFTRRSDVEDIIVYVTGYSWTWDLDHTGLTPDQYKKMLTRLYAVFGFSEYKTNEPNVCLKPENFFMARIGARVPSKIRDDFNLLRFGITLS